MNVVIFAASDDDTRAQESDSGHDALNHSAGVGGTGVPDRQDGQCRTKRHKSECTHTRGLAMKIAVEAKQHAGERSSTKPYGYLESVHVQNLA